MTKQVPYLEKYKFLLSVQIIDKAVGMKVLKKNGTVELRDEINNAFFVEREILFLMSYGLGFSFLCG